jgi:hypothetical protein
LPFEGGTRIGLTARGDKLVTGDSAVGNRWIGLLQRPGQVQQRGILLFSVRQLIRAFELDTNGKIVAVVATAMARCTRVPGTLVAGDKLGNGAIALNQKMRAK